MLKFLMSDMRRQDAVILECERLRQAVERCRVTGGEGGCRLGDVIDIQ